MPGCVRVSVRVVTVHPDLQRRRRFVCRFQQMYGTCSHQTVRAIRHGDTDELAAVAPAVQVADISSDCFPDIYAGQVLGRAATHCKPNVVLGFARKAEDSSTRSRGRGTTRGWPWRM